MLSCTISQERKRDYEEAELHYKQEHAHYTLVKIMLSCTISQERKRDYEEAELHYKRALTLDPRNGDALNNYAVFLHVSTFYHTYICIYIYIRT